VKKEKIRNKSCGAEFAEEMAGEVRADFERRAQERMPFELNWRLNLNFLAGNQFCSVAGRGEIEQDEKYFCWQEREVYNHVAPIFESRLAKLNRVRPEVAVLPFSNDDGDIMRAKVSGKIIGFAADCNDLPKKIAAATLWSEACGTSFYKIVWDGGGGRRAGAAKDGRAIFEGDAKISVCPPFEIFPDSAAAASVDDCRSIIHAKAYSVEEIKEIWGADVKGREIKVFAAGGAGESREGHEIVIERYERPSQKFPDGRLVTVAGDTLLHAGPLPFANGKNGKRGFPFVRQISQHLTGSFWGGSVVDKIIPVQRAYNAVKNRKHEFLNRVSAGVLTVEDGSVDIGNLLDEGLSPGKVVVYRQGSRPPKMMETSHVPLDFTYEEERLLNEFVMISGTSELSRNSATPTNVTSGVALQLLIEQDDTRLSSTAEEIRFAVREISKHLLRLYKQFALTPRIARIAGKNSALEMFYFCSADINSDDVVLTTENEMSNTPAQKRSMLFDLLHNGILYGGDGRLSDASKVKILEMAGFGTWEDAQNISALHLLKADEENLEFAAADVVPLDVDDHGIHIERHTRFVIGADGKKGPAEVLERAMRHIGLHKELLAENYKLQITNYK